jgi:DNA replication protein DnaC
MLQQPMMEKLHALKLQGLLEALERQEQDETARELSFLDRLALLVDQQWNWRQNQALARRVRASRLKGAACVENIDYRAERGLSKSVIRGLAQDSAWVKNHEHIFVLGPPGVGNSSRCAANRCVSNAARKEKSEHRSAGQKLWKRRAKNALGNRFAIPTFPQLQQQQA